MARKIGQRGKLNNPVFVSLSDDEREYVRIEAAIKRVGEAEILRQYVDKTMEQDANRESKKEHYKKLLSLVQLNQ